MANVFVNGTKNAFLLCFWLSTCVGLYEFAPQFPEQYSITKKLIAAELISMWMQRFRAIAHFAIASSVTGPMNENEACCDLELLKTSLLFSCKSFSYATFTCERQ